MFDFNDIAGSCPFAHDAKLENKISIPSIANKKDVISYINNWDDTFEVIIVKPSIFWRNYWKWIKDNQKSHAKLDLILIPNTEKKFILIQRLSLLVKTGKKLMNKGYYDNHDKDKIIEYNNRIELMKLIRD